ncbi:MAG: AMP-binding protein [Polyangiales bacterium]
MKQKDQAFERRDLRYLLAKPISSLGLSNVLASMMHSLFAASGQREAFLRHLLPALWRRLGSRAAIVCPDGRASFAELTDRALRLASGLHELGLRPGDRVGTLLRNEQAWFDTMLACMLSGLKMPMLNTHLRPDELVKCINGAEPKVLVFSRELLATVREIEPQLASVSLFVATQGGGLPEGYSTLQEVRGRGRPRLPPGGFGLPYMPFSGGSTGVPKFIVDAGEDGIPSERTKGMDDADRKRLRRELLRGIARLGIWSIDRDVVTLIPGPLYHSGPQIAVITLFFGSTLVTMDKFDAEEFLRLIEAEGVNYTFVVPTMLERILALPDEVKRKADLSSTQVLLCAAAPCPEHVKREINALFKQQGASRNVFNEYYGSSEATLISVLRPEDYEEDAERYKSVGRPAGSECRIYDPEEGRWCAPGEIGHVLVRNFRMYRIHYGNSDEMDRAFLEVDGVYWYDDGCLGYLSDDGFLYLVSRSKDMIISGGVNVFPPQIEEVLKTHPNIFDAAVVKVPDEDLGEVPGAVIETMDGETMDEAEILAHCKEQGLYGYNLPRAFKFTKRIPKTPAGKIRKSELEKEFGA